MYVYLQQLIKPIIVYRYRLLTHRSYIRHNTHSSLRRCTRETASNCCLCSIVIYAIIFCSIFLYYISFISFISWRVIKTDQLVPQTPVFNTNTVPSTGTGLLPGWMWSLTNRYFQRPRHPVPSVRRVSFRVFCPPATETTSIPVLIFVFASL